MAGWVEGLKAAKESLPPLAPKACVYEGVRRTNTGRWYFTFSLHGRTCHSDPIYASRKAAIKAGKEHCA